MSSTLIILLIVIVFALLVTFIITLMMPAAWTIEERIGVYAGTKDIFPYLNQSKQWRLWSIWSGPANADIKWTYNDIPAGLGATQQWQQLQSSGTLTIVQSNEEESIQYHLDIDQQSFIVYGQLLLAPTDQQTIVIWTCRSELNSFNPFKRLQSAALRRMLTEQMQQSLAHLKAHSEQTAQKA